MASPYNAAPVEEGEVLADKYLIERVIGVGGMGVVVAAMHLELKQRVALKFLLPQAAHNDELVGRFVREVKASLRLKGDHVTKVLDVGRMDDGRAYIVMEHLDGRDLGAEYEKNGQSASAWGAFREAEGLARKAGRTDWEAAAHARAGALEPRLLRLSIQVAPATRVPGLVVVRDGARISVGEYGVPIPVDPGEHVIRATADGRKPWEDHITVTEPNVTSMIPELELQPVAEAQPPGPSPVMDTPPPSRWTPLRTAGAVTAGAGVVGLVTGGLVALVARSAYADARDRCTGTATGCPASAVADSESAYGTATAATVIFVAGAALLVGGATLYLLAPNAARARGVHIDPRGLAATW